MTARELVTVWGFEIDDKPLNKLSERFNLLKGQAKELIELFLAEATAVWELAERTAETAQQASNLAKTMGTSVQSIQRLEFAAKFAGVSAESLQQGLRRLSMEASNAAMGGAESNEAFSRLGISLTDSNGKMKNSTQLFMDMSKAVKSMPDGVMKSGLLFQLLSRGGGALAPVLDYGPERLKQLGIEAEKVGYVMSNTDVAAGVAFKEALHGIEAVLQGITQQIGIKLLPTWTKLMTGLTQWYEKNQEFIQSGITEFISIMANGLSDTYNIVMFLVKGIGMLTDNFKFLMPILKVVAMLMAGFAAASTIMAIAGIVEVVKELSLVMKIAAMWETVMTGGANLLTAGAVIAGLGVAGFAGWELFHKRDIPTANNFQGLPGVRGPGQQGGFGLSGMMPSGGGNTQITQHISLPPGTPEEHVRAVADGAAAALAEANRGAARGFTRAGS